MPPRPASAGVATPSAPPSTSDSWADALKLGWLQVKDSHRQQVKRLVIHPDNGPKNPGTRTQWLKRMAGLSDRSGLEIRLVCYPPYHSRYNPTERRWPPLAQKWGGTLLDGLKVVWQQARRMSRAKRHPRSVKRIEGDHAGGVRLSKKEMKPYEARLLRSRTLPKYDITIKPLASDS